MGLRSLIVGASGGAALLLGGTVLAATPAEDYAAGLHAYQQENLIPAMQLLERAAEAGHPEAQVLLGYILDRAENNAAAMRYYSLAAASGNAEGAYRLGVLYATGEGVERDPAAAVDWMRRAVEGAYWPAAVVLARAYLEGGLGLAVDRAEAERLLRQAADAGDEPARSALEALTRDAVKN